MGLLNSKGKVRMVDHPWPRSWAAGGLRVTRRALRMRRPLQWKMEVNAVVVPFVEPLDISKGAGVVLERNSGFEFVRGTGLRRYSRETLPPPWTEGLNINRSIPRGLYGGIAFPHFGHFLLEGLARLWIEQIKDIDVSIPLVLIAYPPSELRPMMFDICRRIGLEREIVFVDASTGPLSVDELIIPEPGFELREWMHPMQLRRLSTTPWQPEVGDKRVWLSRTQMGNSAGYAQEPEVEAVLADLGWLIVRPEDLPIDDQIDLLASSSHIAGVEGSALHGLVLVKDFGGTIDILPRRYSHNYNFLASLAGWNQRWIKAVGGHPSTEHVPNSMTGVTIDRITVDGIDVVATALAIDRSSRRKTNAH